MDSNESKTPTNDMTELRAHLFDTLRGLKGKTIDIDQAKAISDTANSIIHSAKVEVDYLRVTGQSHGSAIFGGDTPKTPALPNGITGSTVHKIK